MEQSAKMKFRNTAIALGFATATAAILSLTNLNKNFIVGSTTVVVGAGLMVFF